MTLQTLNFGMYIPPIPSLGGTTPVLVNQLIDATSEKAAVVCFAPKTGTIDKVALRTGTVSTGDTVNVRLETVSLTTGDPTGTLLGTDSNKTQVIADTDDNKWFLTTLTTGVAVTKGDIFAVVIANGSVPGNINISGFRLDTNDVVYGDLFAGAGPSWTKQANAMVTAFEYDDGTYAHAQGVAPVKLLNNMSIDTGTTPDEIGIIFQVPFASRAAGFWIIADLDGDADIVLYDSDGTSVLQSFSLDKDLQFSGAVRPLAGVFSGGSVLTKDTNYRLVAKPTSLTNIVLREIEVDIAAQMDAMPAGQNFHRTERTDAGSWTQTTMKIPLMGILLDQLDDGVGGSASGVRNPLVGPVG